MTKQLTLIDTQPDWRLDEKTRKVGCRGGIAEARAALAAGAAPGPAAYPLMPGPVAAPRPALAPGRRRVRTRPHGHPVGGLTGSGSPVTGPASPAPRATRP